MIKEKEIIEENTKVSDDINKQIKIFKDNKIWTTKKARMYAEQRIIKEDNKTNFIMNYYNILILATSIITLVYDYKSVSLLTVIASVALLGMGSYITSMNYKEKIFKYRESYLKLARLEDSCEFLLLENDINMKKSKFEKMKGEYNSILENSINHEKIDYEGIIVNGQVKGAMTVLKYEFKRECKVICALIIPIIILMCGFIWK